MAKTVAVSFEGDSVKVLHSSLKGNTLSIIKSDVIPDTEFDDYLQHSRANEFIVTCNFLEAIHDTVTVPPVKAKYQKKVIASKIRKITNRQDLSYISYRIGEQRSGKQKDQEIYFFGVSESEIKGIIDRFHKQNKMVKAIYPSLFAAAALLKRSFKEESVLGALNSGVETGVFFLKNGDIHFIRNYESTSEALTDFDIQNINMTINYCFQNLRTNPSSVLLLGGLTSSSEITTTTSSPLASFLKPEEIICSREVFSDFLLPVASVYTSKDSNIMTQDFKNIFALRSYMTYAAALFIILAFLSLGYSWFTGTGIKDKRKSISQASASLQNVDSIYAAYEERTENISRLMTMVDFVNISSPDLSNLLVTIGRISSDNMTFTSMNAKLTRDNSYDIVIKGTSRLESYAKLQGAFQKMLDIVTDVRNVELKNSDLNISSQSFSVELIYKKSS